MKFEDVLIFAIQAHSGQFRVTREQYIIHPIRVSELIKNWLYNHKDVDFIRACALMHDLIEDSWVTKQIITEKFGKNVAEIIDALSLNKSLPVKERNEEYEKKLMNAHDYVKLIKLADIWDNVHDSPSGKDWTNYRNEALEILKKIEVKDESLVLIFNEKKKVLMKKIKELLGKN